MSDHNSHEKREQARLEREHAQLQRESEQAAREARKSTITLVLVLILFVAVAAGIIYALQNKPTMYVDREVHWHSNIEFNICGVPKEIPCDAKGSGVVHGKEFCGETLMHHHFDGTLHIEGVIPKKEDIMLGRFFDKIGVPFDKDKLLDKKNGDLCDGVPGVVKMYVNGIESSAFRDYVPAATTDGRNQRVKIVFEPVNGMRSSNLTTPLPI